MKNFVILFIASLTVFAGDLPNSKLTPGATVDVSLAKLCVKGYASSVRLVPDKVKNAVYAEYGITSHPAGAFEVDHLISLELGGSNDQANLWPQSYTSTWNAHVKDALEDRLHALVCAANPTMTLAQAQHGIRTDWISLYKKVFATTNTTRNK